MTYWNSCKDCSACLLIWKCETLWNAAWISWADKVCSSVCRALCAFAMSASGIRKSLDSSLDLRVTHWKALHPLKNLYAEFWGFTVFSHHSTRSSMDRACSPVRLCARLWRQNSLWGLPNTGGNAFYVTSANPRFVSLPHSNPKELAPHLESLLTSIVNFKKVSDVFCKTNSQLGHPVMPNAPGQQSGYLQ